MAERRRNCLVWQLKQKIFIICIAITMLEIQANQTVSVQPYKVTTTMPHNIETTTTSTTPMPTTTTTTATTTATDANDTKQNPYANETQNYDVVADDSIKTGQTTHIFTSGIVDDAFWLKLLGEDYKTAIKLEVGGSDLYNQLLKNSKNGLHTEVHHEYLPGAELENVKLHHETTNAFDMNLVESNDYENARTATNSAYKKTHSTNFEEKRPYGDVVPLDANDVQLTNKYDDKSNHYAMPYNEKTYDSNTNYFNAAQPPAATASLASSQPTLSASISNSTQTQTTTTTEKQTHSNEYIAPIYTSTDDYNDDNYNHKYNNHNHNNVGESIYVHNIKNEQHNHLLPYMLRRTERRGFDASPLFSNRLLFKAPLLNAYGSTRKRRDITAGR